MRWYYWTGIALALAGCMGGQVVAAMSERDPWVPVACVSVGLILAAPALVVIMERRERALAKGDGSK